MNGYLIGLIALAVLVGAICKARNINPAIPLIVAGFVFQEVTPDFSALPEPEFILTMVLAPLVFAAGLSSSAVDLAHFRRSVLALAVGLVIVTCLIVGVLASLAFAVLGFATACALGAILGPTDAVAASVVAKRTGLPHRVRMVVEGESLANDGTALTALRVAVAAAVAGSVTVVTATGILLAAVVGGIAIGALGGWLVSWLVSRSTDGIVGNCFLLLAPFVLYMVSEQIGGSGLLTVVIAGVWIAHSSQAKTSYQFRLQSGTVWSVIGFVLECFAFVLVGAEFVVTIDEVSADHPLAGIALASAILLIVLLVIRACFMGGWFLLTPWLNRAIATAPRYSKQDFIAITVLGVRGPVSVLAAFSLPVTLNDGTPLPGRELILLLTFGVVILSLLLSLTAAPIIRRLDFGEEQKGEALHAARVATASAALTRLDELIEEAELSGEPLPEPIVNRIRASAVRRLDTLQATSTRRVEARHETRAASEVQRQMIAAERKELLRLRTERRIPGTIITQLSAELDLREAALGPHTDR